MRRCALFLLIALAVALLAVGAQAQERSDAASDPPAAPRISRLNWSGLTIRVGWNPVARATGYDLRWTPAEQRRRQLTVSAVDGSPAEFSAPWAGRWRVEVRARIGSGPSAVRGAWSRPRIVRVYDAPPRLGVERFDGEYALLNWTGVGASYELEWGERGGAKQFVRRDGRSPTLKLGPLKGGKTYEFRVRARDEAGRSDYSPTAVFTPTAWRGFRPGAAYVGRIGQIYALWLPQRGAEWYELSWINAADPTETARVRVGTATTGGSRAQVPGQIGRAGGFENGTWNVRVRAGPRGAWSPLYPLTLSNQPERLALELESSRELCTAGTLTEIMWKISGGSAPYALSIENSAVDVSADNVRINCGALSEAEAADEDAALAAKRITAVVTDARGVRREAALDVARARALPPLQSAEEYGDTVSAYRGAMGFEWHAPAAPYSCRSPNCYAIRWRAVGAEAWAYAPLTHHLDERNLAFGLVRNLADGVVYEAAGAAMRDPIELQTPEALRWTSPLSGTTLTDPTGLTATATHDTITVRWNRQPSARFWSVDLYGPDGALGQDVVRRDTASWGDPATGVHEVVFRHLPASTRYEVRVGWNVMEGYEPTSAKTSVETLSLPADSEPLLRGPQNLRATATHDSITVTWDQPFAAVTDPYWLYLFRGDDEYGASRHGTAWHPSTQFTFSGLKPDMTYRVVVLHMAIVRASAEVSVTTRAMPQSDAPVGGASAEEWPLPGTFRPVWPHALRTTTGKWSVLTEDVWVARGDRESGRWHGGIDTVLADRGGEPQQIQAVADGILQEYNPEVVGFILFCPGSSTSSALIDQIQTNGKSNGSFGGVPCTELANRYHGRVAFTFHEYANALYVVQYAHLSAFGTASQPRTIPSQQARRVTAGEPIGIEGGTGVNDHGVWSETASLPHLHMTIRVFTRASAEQEVAKTVGGKWRALSARENWQCGDVTDGPTYCHLPRRRIRTTVDPEKVLAPAPPAVSETGPGRGVPLWNSVTHADQVHDVNNRYKRFLLRRVDVETVGQTDVVLDVAVWRPHLYTYSYIEDDFLPPDRFLVPGLAATREGVPGYFASTGGCGSIVKSGPNDEIAFAKESSGNRFWSEVEPMRLTVTLRDGRESCDVSVGSYNEHHEAGAIPVEGAYGRDAMGQPSRPGQLTARVSMNGTALSPSETAVTLAGQSLAKFEFRLYEFEAVAGHTYYFETEVELADDVVLEWWQGGQLLKSAVDGPGSVTLTWTATKSGTAHIVARGGIISTSPWSGTYALKYRKTSPIPGLAVSVSPRSASCYTGGTVSISWRISNGTTPYAVKVNGVSASGTRKTVTCRSTAGTQTVSVTATDASTPQRSGSASVSLTVTNPPLPPRVRPAQPDPVVTTERVGQRTEYEWRPYGDLPGGLPPDPPGTCYYLLFERERYRLAEFETSWRFDVSSWMWKLDPASKRQIGLETEDLFTPWVENGRRHTLTCPDPAQGVSGASAPPAGTLLPGDYVVAWGGEWFSFTIPSDARVQWTSRTVGEQEAMVFSLAGGAEVVIIPSQIETNPPTSDNAALSAIVASFRAETDPAKLPASAQQQTCAEAPARDDAGALTLDLTAQWCSVVSSGGDLSVRYGEDRISLTIPAERVWLIFAAAQSESAAAAGIWVMERQSKAYVILSPSDGAELDRHSPAEADGLPALLDAIVASSRAAG